MSAPGAGQLNRQISIQQRSQTKDAEGGMVDAWVDVFPAVLLWARVNNLSGNERSSTKQGGQVSDARTEFTIYYLAGVTNEMRISYNSKHYNIRHVNNYMDLNEYLIITCDTGGNHGR
ncbi:MAG: phage head closure protein [Nitrosomonas sp.]|uniref:phage head closure protein n=1 Tax=Nitrosomonas sp. TaxID=42353 RepID=UPI0025CD4516|nr:phage head closure protein [Nitrosomonas sp.]MBY0474214.1 phage head closure protein [Nitrosomonas sp.]